MRSSSRRKTCSPCGAWSRREQGQGKTEDRTHQDAVRSPFLSLLGRSRDGTRRIIGGCSSVASPPSSVVQLSASC